ncbi:MAG: hypothetical protein LBP55_08480 [Candidatus Adiutrix sp.]|nr:hypothetical protein [Candidatus Adiutrix sp.]
MGLLTAALGAAGQYSGARAESEGLKAQAAAEQMQARINETRAAAAADRSRLAEAGAAEENYQRAGRRRAGLAQAGLLNSPTGLELLESEAEADRRREGEAGEPGRREALNYLLQQGRELTGAAQTLARARQAQRAGALGAASSILAGVARGYGGRR